MSERGIIVFDIIGTCFSLPLQPKMGFNRFAELWNGRLAMVGFLTAIVVEAYTGQGILGQLGIL